MEPPKPPQDIELRNIIDKLAQFVARNGPDFEQMTKTKQKGNAKFAFLFGGEYYSYYQYKVTAEQTRLQCSSPGPLSLGMNPPNPAAGGGQWPAGSIGSIAAPLPPPPPPTLTPTPFSLTVPPVITIESLTQQQNALHEQTTQSEQNLNAQQMVLLQQQQVQIEEAIRKSEFEALQRDSETANINFAEFDVVLQPIVDTCTKDSISNGKAWILRHTSTSPKSNDIIIKYLLHKITEPDKKFNQRLHMIYLVNDVLHHCSRKHLDDFKASLEKVVVPMFSFTSLNVTEEQQTKLTKLLNIWETKNHYFSDEIMSKLKEPAASWAAYKQSEQASHPEIVEQCVEQTKTAFQGFQSQHLAFVQHTLHQIQTLEQQKQQLETVQKQQQAAAEQAAAVAAAAAAAVAQQAAAQQQAAQLIREEDGDEEEEEEEGPPGVDLNELEDGRPSRFRDFRDRHRHEFIDDRGREREERYIREYDRDYDYERSNREEWRDDRSLGDWREERGRGEWSERASQGERGQGERGQGERGQGERGRDWDRGQPTPERTRDWPERSGGGGERREWERGASGREWDRGPARPDRASDWPDRAPAPERREWSDQPQPPIQPHDNGHLADLGINLNQPPPGFFPPPNIELPDVTRPPPGFPVLQTTPQPPQPEVQPEDLLPSLPYYDLPAGLMVPLIKLEEFKYRSLDPDQIRLPPPAPPSDRLLAAVKAFYTPPGHDHPRDSDGWEKLGLYEYYRAKANAKKRKEMEIIEGLREKSRSPTPVRSFFHGEKTPPPKRRYSSRSRSRSRERGSRRGRGRRERDRSPSAASGNTPSRPQPPSLLQMPILPPPPGHPDHQARRSPSPPQFGGMGLGGGNRETVEERLTETNKGHQLLKKMGWSGAGLGANEQGIETPIASADVRDKADQYKGVGINLNDPYENFRKSKGQAYIIRMKARAEEKAASS